MTQSWSDKSKEEIIAQLSAAIKSYESQAQQPMTYIRYNGDNLIFILEAIYGNYNVKRMFGGFLVTERGKTRFIKHSKE